MSDAELARELCVIGRDLDEILRNENLAAAELDRRFAENETAIQHLLRSIQEAVTAGEWRKTEFNVFEILGHVRGELAHSSVLAWLLDPVESHGLGDAFLREFMRKSVGVEPPSVIDIRVVPEFPFHDCRFDIYVKGERWCLVVENKIEAPLLPSQHKRYVKFCEGRKARGDQSWLVYVTPRVLLSPGKAPMASGRRWNHISYREFRRILDQI